MPSTDAHNQDDTYVPKTLEEQQEAFRLCTEFNNALANDLDENPLDGADPGAAERMRDISRRAAKVFAQMEDGKESSE